MTRPCTHGMPSPSSCYECMEEGNLAPPERPPAPTVERFLDARFDGHCQGCNTGIHIGQPIARLSDGTYQHQACVRGVG